MFNYTYLLYISSTAIFPPIETLNTLKKKKSRQSKNIKNIEYGKPM